jgi:hypothetical protein
MRKKFSPNETHNTICVSSVSQTTNVWQTMENGSAEKSDGSAEKFDGWQSIFFFDHPQTPCLLV